MMNFESAFAEFKKNGCFKLKNSTLTFSELSHLQSLVQQLALKSYRPTSGYQIILQDVGLIPFFHLKQEIIPPLFSAVTATEYSSMALGDQLIDLALIYFDKKNDSQLFLEMDNSGVGPNISFEKFEKKLLDLFVGYGFWSGIEFKNVYFYHNSHLRYLSDFFHYHLLDIITNQTQSLKILKITPTATLKKPRYKNPLSDIQPTKNQSLLENRDYVKKFMCFLKFNTQLSLLNIESFSDTTLFIQEISELLRNYTQINYLDLAIKPLKKEAYQALINLSYENYRIKTLKISTPTDASLSTLHQTLILRFAMDPKERFKQDWITSEKLTSLAIAAIQENNITLLQIMIRSKKSVQSVSLMDFNSICDSLPPVYKQHREYVQDYINDFVLDLNETLTLDSYSATIGGHLISTALLDENFGIFFMLAEAFNPGLTECFRQRSLITEQLLFSLTDNNLFLPTWKNQLLTYFKEKNDLISLFPGFIHLKSYSEIYQGLNSIKQYLDGALQKLIARNQWPRLLRFIPGFSFLFEKYQAEWNATFHILAELSHDLETTQQNLDVEWTMEKITQAMQRIIDRVESSQHGDFPPSEFNQTLLSLSQTILTETTNYKSCCIGLMDSIQPLNEALDDEIKKEEINAASISPNICKTKASSLDRFFREDKISAKQIVWLELKEVNTAQNALNIKY